MVKPITTPRPLTGRMVLLCLIAFFGTVVGINMIMRKLAIDSLPERYRLPVVLRHLQELSYDEISRFTGESRDEIRGILQRAGRQLRDLLGDLEATEGDSQWRPAHK